MLTFFFHKCKLTYKEIEYTSDTRLFISFPIFHKMLTIKLKIVCYILHVCHFSRSHEVVTCYHGYLHV